MVTPAITEKSKIARLKCDPFWENLPIRVDKKKSDLLIKA